ncbi:GntR family transcriptional regulator [Cellvibrio zantedeschiae]|uniref:GntR family transcriptional regulator n=1 Tax=Cellvibrio zantedeschiae TaxID=1237077 RepID=A0ABQ3B383_9GAMM|nr:GntR family transcriptional regulator [Cellvibrio zantedeschiae]GGY77275.1 GntR family transcriptional regulator [Cellvibrio zantedeschiae]
MTHSWNDDQPIYRQLRERIVSLMLTGVFKEGDPLPSVRQVASDYQINHLTVSKAYQELVDMQLVEARRGMGMYVMPGAQEKLHGVEKEKFLTTELPALLARIKSLGISTEELCAAILKSDGEK